MNDYGQEQQIAKALMPRSMGVGELIESRIGANEDQLQILREAKALLEKNPDLKRLLELLAQANLRF